MQSFNRGDNLTEIQPERLALLGIAGDYCDKELYDHLRLTLEMTDEEIGKAGFALSEFYADPEEYDCEAGQEYDYDEER